MSEQNDTAYSEEPAQLYDFAMSVLEECNAAVPLSDLDTAISLFQETLDRRPAPHPLRSDSLKDLAGALVARFSLTNQRQDLDQAAILLLYDISLMGQRGQFEPEVRVRSILFLKLDLTI
jgi:hypothetical protein